LSHSSLFQSFFIGGFECSCHRLRSGKRLDLLQATQHDRYVVADYQRLTEFGILTARDGLRWPLIETTPYHYDFSSVLPMLRAARESGLQVIWDLFHYGWPDDIDIFQPEFVRRFRAFAAAFAKVLADETEGVPFICPVNEISYFAWAAGDAGYLNPFELNRSYELKVQLVRAAIEASEAIWELLPTARMVHVDPVINIVADPTRPEDRQPAEEHRLAQYQAWDMISGRHWPLLGGTDSYLDIIGVNYYDHNQWVHDGEFLDPTHPLYRPFSDILLEVYARYGRPLFIAETGVEGDMRAGWLNYICDEVRTAMEAGVPIEGICVYPICDYPGWDDERCCQTGMWGYVDEEGRRELHKPLAEELQRQQTFFADFRPHSTNGMVIADLERLASGENESKPGICLFTDSFDPSGMGEHMLTLAKQLLEHYRILFVCPPGEKGDPFLDRAETLGCVALPLSVHGSRSAAKTLHWWLHEMSVEIFHCHAGIGWEGHDGIDAAHEYGVPVIIRTEHLPYLLTDPRQQAEHRALVPLIDHVICVSEEAAKSYSKAGIPTEKLTVIRNGIEAKRVEPDRQRIFTEFGLSPTAKIVLTVARMTEQKGHRYLLDAMPEIMAAVPDAHFIWVGEGPLERDLRRQMKALNIDTPRLVLAGRRTDVPDLLAAADLFVLPSLFEGLPLVVLEAMALNVPIVGTRVCGTSEAITDGFTGRLVEARNSSALAVAIIEALTQPSLTARWVHAGRTRFEQEFSAARMAAETTALYERLRTSAQSNATDSERTNDTLVAANG
jgi:glycosyltransferase involved in cell wall biosynthesis